MIICLYGPDGSGKTTLAHLLAAILRRRGYRARVAWLRGTHGFLSLLARFLARSRVFRGDCNPYYGICVPSGLRGLWLLLEYLAVIPIYIARYLVPSALGFIVIGDRCLVDFLAWLRATLGTTTRYRFLEGLVVREIARSINIYVYADKRILVERRPCERDQIERFYGVYEALAQVLGARLRIDTSNTTPPRIAVEVASLLENVLRETG